jgi:predicted SAM-dependent methyltransferase
MTETFINLGCGHVFVDSPEWINLDFSSVAPSVRRANLLARLPLPSEGAKLVYASHFLEHIPKPDVAAFLKECHRVLEPGGVLRLVLPDLQEMASSYLRYREAGDHVRADFLVMEIIDQCVRRTAGGELGRFYRSLRVESLVDQAEMNAFVRERNGEDLEAQAASPQKPIMKLRWGELALLSYRLCNRLQRAWLQLWLLGLPAVFRSQNVSLASVGERHHWLWDFYQLQQALEVAGFTAIERCSAQTSAIANFPFYPLDVDAECNPRKGVGSMYIEAIKPSL